MNLKEKILGALGTFGFILWYGLCFLFIAIPFSATNLPMWITIILAAIMFNTELIGTGITIFVYAYSFVQMLHEPFGWFSVVYYINLAVYVIFFFIPSVIKFIRLMRSKDDILR